MKAEVLVTGWSVRNRRFTKGEIFDLGELAGQFADSTRVDGYRRLGFFKELEASPETKGLRRIGMASMLKSDLLDLADKRGVEVPGSATKATIIELLEEN